MLNLLIPIGYTKFLLDSIVRMKKFTLRKNYVFKMEMAKLYIITYNRSTTFFKKMFNYLGIEVAHKTKKFFKL